MFDEAVVRASAERNFQDLDADGDGVLTKDDYVALAERRLAETGTSADSPEGQTVIESFLGAWDTHVRLMDANRDGEISKKEYVSSFETMVRTGDIDSVLEPMFRTTFDLADRDHDGMLVMEEFRSLWSRPPADLTKEFAEVDTNGDGRISFQEYFRARRKLLVGS